MRPSNPNVFLRNPRADDFRRHRFPFGCAVPGRVLHRPIGFQSKSGAIVFASDSDQDDCSSHQHANRVHHRCGSRTYGDACTHRDDPATDCNDHTNAHTHNYTHRQTSGNDHDDWDHHTIDGGNYDRDADGNCQRDRHIGGNGNRDGHAHCHAPTRPRRIDCVSL